EWVEPPGAFRLLGFTRIPVFVLLLGWFVLSSFLPVGSGFHDVRFLTVPASATGVPPSLKGELTRPAQLLRRWLRDLPPEAFQPGAGGARRGVPVIFVATAGGGVRAAYWTSLVLDCLFQPHPVPTPTDPCPGAPGGRDATSSIIVGSGISGGSLGLVDYVTHDVQVTEGRSDGPNWVRTRLGGDYLAPSLAWQLAVELPRAFFRFDTGMDRAEAIERALQQSWVDGPWTPGWEHFLWQGSDAQDDGPLTQGFLDLWRRQATGPGETRAAVPLLVLNGTSVTDGCRVNTSALDANGNHFGQPGGDRVARQIGCLSTRIFDQRTGEPLAEVLAATRDFDDYLCVVNGQQRVDVRLSTAALLSARFPFVSPAGRITDCGSTGQATYVVDGGYLDSSGAATAVELWQALEPFIASYNAGSSLVGGDPSTTCLVPYLIQIDNGYQEPSPAPPTKRPGELTFPLRTLFKARSAFTALTRQDGAVLFNHPIAADGIQVADRYAHFFPRGHPGVEAPLGWVLSNGATNDLEAQIAENQQEIADVRAWLSDPLPCGS
ncbi:MAG TPA: hypothetical protein VF972_11180, partial [Actinomycetota bacterium]